VRSPSSALVDVTVSLIFLPIVPDRKPRTECGCQPVAFISSLAVTPPARLSRSSTLAVLLPSRAPTAFFAPLGAFFAGLAFLGDLPFFGATWALRGATRAFLLAFGCSLLAAFGVAAVSTINSVILISPLAVITVTTSITPVAQESKQIR
jgi:hypothetical protein